MEVSYGEMLSIFQLPPIFSSWEMLLDLIQKSYENASDSSGVHYIALWILSYLARKGENWALETTDLDLSGCNLVSLPQNMHHLKNLTSLYLNDNALTYIPYEFGELPLTSLNLNNNQLQELPSSLSSCPLTELYLDDNAFEDFPSVVCKISSLTIFSIQNNSFSRVPAGFSKLSNLTSVDFYDNNIDTLPKDLGSFKPQHA